MTHLQVLLYGESYWGVSARTLASASLQRWALVIGVRAEHTAVSRFWAKNNAAARTSIEDDASIRRHLFFLRETTIRAVDNRRRLDVHSSFPS